MNLRTVHRGHWLEMLSLTLECTRAVLVQSGVPSPPPLADAAHLIQDEMSELRVCPRAGRTEAAEELQPLPPPSSLLDSSSLVRLLKSSTSLLLSACIGATIGVVRRLDNDKRAK